MKKVLHFLFYSLVFSCVLNSNALAISSDKMSYATCPPAYSKDFCECIAHESLKNARAKGHNFPDMLHLVHDVDRFIASRYRGNTEAFISENCGADESCKASLRQLYVNMRYYPYPGDSGVCVTQFAAACWNGATPDCYQ